MIITIVLRELGNPRVFQNIEINTLPVLGEVITAPDGPRLVIVAYPSQYKGHWMFSTVPAQVATPDAAASVGLSAAGPP